MKIETQKQINETQLAELVETIARMTDEDNHTGAVCALAEFVGDKDEVDEAHYLEKMHDEISHTPWTLILRRNSLRDRIMLKITASHGWTNAMAVWRSF